MEKVEGVSSLHVETQTLVPQLRVKLRPDAASRFGLTAGTMMRSVTTLVNGTLVGEIYEDQKVFGVVVRGERDLCTDVVSLQRLLIDTPSGAQVPLGDVADIAVVPTPNEIQREGASRRIDVTCNASGRDLGSVAREIEERVLADVTFPRRLPSRVSRRIRRSAGVSQANHVGLGAGVPGHLAGAVRRLSIVAAGAADDSLACRWPCWAAWSARIWPAAVVSLGSLVGFVTVLGIAARNAIMLISHYRHLQQNEGVAFGDELVIRGAEERLSPILMTALTTGLALLPLAVTGNLPGQEIEYPMALVILGGLVTSTLLNLFVLPVVYHLVAADIDAPVDPSANSSIL